MRWAFGAQAALFLLFVPVVLIVPEIPLGRVVGHDARWMLAMPATVLALVSGSVAWRGEDSGRAAVAVLGLAAAAGLVAAAWRGGPQALVLVPLLGASLGLCGWRLRR